MVVVGGVVRLVAVGGVERRVLGEVGAVRRALGVAEVAQRLLEVAEGVRKMVGVGEAVLGPLFAPVSGMMTGRVMEVVAAAGAMLGGEGELVDGRASALIGRVLGRLG